MMQKAIYQSADDIMVTMIADPQALERNTTGLWRNGPLPPELAWAEQLSQLHYRVFLVELYEAVGAACIHDDWVRVVELLEDWEATAEVDANEELSKYLLSKPEEKDYQEVDLPAQEN